LSWNQFILSLSRWKPRSQLSWITIDNKIAVDYIAKFENFTGEIDYIFNRLGLKYNKIPHRLKQKRLHYTKYYNNRSRRMAAKALREDIKTFGYKYGTTI
jgi:hypothetical protein